ncbi:hypothetical protein RP20_CCG016671 [Aedes albopictus]|uniref:RING-type E3 ubiquitin transferase n=1 Tax=Aedes albopictus TaxID=7160 RepID=A0A023EF60_AEDAL|nr:probable E3 ubiquitin-protein ligase XERICO [Aedes albopictus]KXJ84214.1 hypothetical protein RP20_CCG016671 [Aedes albopictus]
MVLQGVFTFASSLALGVVALVGIYYTYNYYRNQWEEEPFRRSRPVPTNPTSSKRWESCDDTSDSNCTICLISVNDEGAKTKLVCGHLFHKRCINGWLQHSKFCPNCREPARFATE